VATTSSPAVGTRRFPAKLLLGLGIVLVLLGPALYVVQLRAKILTVPWYALAVGTAGVALLLLAALRRPSVWRIGALAVAGLVTGAEWYFVLSLSTVPAYTGPVEAGVAFPPFRTTLADGSVFNQDSMRGDQNTALVFFRGRW